MEWWQPSKPNEVHAEPWIHPEAIVYLDSILRPDFSVIEHGCGGSTLWMSERVKLVWAFESDPDWIGVISKRCGSNVKIFTADAALAIFAKDMQFDLVFIDGEPLESRKDWLNVASKLAPNGWIVLDNANRPHYKAERDELEKCATLRYRSPLVGQYLVTEFWQCASA